MREKDLSRFKICDVSSKWNHALIANSKILTYSCFYDSQTLRIYQQKCESCDTTIHPYTSYQYSWDEPCYLHRLIVEVCVNLPSFV